MSKVDEYLEKAAKQEDDFVKTGSDIKKKGANLYFKKAMQEDGNPDYKGPILP